MDLGSSIRRRRRPGREREQDARREAADAERNDAGKGRSSGNRRGGGASDWARRALRNAGIALGLVAVGGGAGYVVATIVLFPLPETPSEWQGVPRLQGRALQAALAEVADSGLVVERVDSVRHPTAPIGTVLGQSPLPGPTALPGAAVRVTVSLGPDLRDVPDVTRLPGERAAALLSAGGFRVQVDTVESALPAGRVAGIDPQPGARLAIPGDVRLRVSQGPPTFPMPDLTGAAEALALAVLDSLGLAVDEVDRRFSLLNVGAVFGQAPEPNVPVEAGARVRIVVGEEMVRRAAPPELGSGRPPGSRSRPGFLP